MTGKHRPIESGIVSREHPSTPSPAVARQVMDIPILKSRYRKADRASASRSRWSERKKDSTSSLPEVEPEVSAGGVEVEDSDVSESTTADSFDPSASARNHVMAALNTVTSSNFLNIFSPQL